MCATFKAMVAALIILILQHIVSSAPASSPPESPPTSAHHPDPEMLQYLEQVFEDAKSLNRPLVRGELNLLPSGMDGFANTVRCFFDTNHSMSDNFRILKFNLSSLSLLDEVASVQLVLKQSSCTTSSYTSQLYKIIGDSTKQVDLLDSGEYSGQWHTLQVQDSISAGSLLRTYHLALAITSEDGNSVAIQDILRTIKPMMLVYTNSLDRLGKEIKIEIERLEAQRREEKNDEASLVREESWQTKQKSKRNTNQDMNAATLSLDELKSLSCRKQVTPSALDLRLYEAYILSSPTELNFSFCYGTCTNPLQTRYTHMYNNHARSMALTDPNLASKGISPCCIPHEMTTIKVIYSSTINDGVIMTSFPIVVSCRCM